MADSKLKNINDIDDDDDVVEQQKLIKKTEHLLNVVGKGVFCLVLQNSMEYFVGPGLIDRLSSNPTQTARTLGLLGGGGALLEFFSTPLSGKLSDATGRKPFVVWAPAVVACCRAFVAISPSLLSTSINRIISAAAMTSYFTIWRAALADLTTQIKGKASFASANALIGVYAGTAAIFGPLLSSTFINYFGIDKGVTIIYSICCVLMSINTYLMGSMFPETLKPSERKPFKLSDAAPWSFIQLYKTSPIFAKLMAVQGIQTVAEGRNIGDVNYLTMAEDYGWDTAKIARQYSLMGISLVGSGLMVKKSLSTFGLRGHTTLSNITNGFGFAFWGSGNLLARYGIPIDATMLIALALLIPGGRKRDGVESLIVNLGEKHGYGRGFVSGAQMNNRAVVNIISPIVLGYMYSIATRGGRKNGYVPWLFCALTAFLAEGLFQTMTNKELCLDKKGMPIA
jgi:MFS family permease